MQDTKDSGVFPRTIFEGKVAAGEFQATVEFCAEVGADCRLVVEPLIVPANAYVALAKQMGRPGRHSEPITLNGSSQDGVLFSSEHMEVSGIQSGSSGNTVKVRTGEASLSVPRARDYDTGNLGLKFHLRSFRSFRPQPVETPLGMLTVQGATRTSSVDEVSGSITIQAPDEDVTDDWYSDAEAFGEFVWKGLQFGHGGRLHVPLVREFRQTHEVATFYRGSGRPAHLASIHFLDQSEFIGALVDRYFADDDFPNAVWQAVGWLNNDSSIDEVRFLTLMTAIETILHTLVPNADSTLIPKLDFKPIQDALLEQLASFNREAEVQEVLASNIRQINRAPLSTRLKAVVDKYGLSTDTFDQALIRRLNKQRVSIVHRGASLAKDDLWECLLYAREMIALIVFAELRYRGQYQSYAEGHEQRNLR